MNDRMTRLSKEAKIYIAGHGGMVGSAIHRLLAARGYSNLIVRSRAELDLLNQGDTYAFLQEERPDYIFIAAAKVGGIQANNTYRAEFLYENLAIASNLLEGAHRAGVQSLMFLGSSCIYPRNCPQPMREDYLLTGPLEQTNEPYAIAKIAGIKLCDAYNAQYGRQYISVMPTNLYGPGDNYNLATSHVLPALLRKTFEAKERGDSCLAVWGSGRPRREFLYVDDMADACVYLMEAGYNGPMVNVGVGHDVTIEELARIIMQTIGLKGELVFDPALPDGTPRKLMDVSRLHALGWTAKTSLYDGLRLTWEDFLANHRTW